jgi:restriction system protein
MTEPTIPGYRDLLYPTLQALDALGGSGTKDEVDSTVIARLDLSDDQLAVEYPPQATAKGSKVIHRLAWARSSMKLANGLDNSTRGVWSLNPVGRELLAGGDEAVRAADSEMRRRLRELRAERRAESKEDPRPPDDLVSDDGDPTIDETGPESSWQRQLLGVLLALSPPSFERVCGRLLREVGFARVEILGRSNDGGIDGSGLLEVALLSFPMYFQCKRYDGTVGPEKIRDFRGAMVGRGDKGLFMTTGTFTPAARHEAQRTGAPPIDLIDGERLCNLLKEHRLGITVETVERVGVDENFFAAF